MIGIEYIGDVDLRYAHHGDAGVDLASTGPVHLYPGSSRPVHTGVRVAIPYGYFGLVAPRSGLGIRGIVLRNLVGIIDSGYRGEIICQVWNATSEPYTIAQGERIAQMVIVPCETGAFRKVDTLPSSERGEGGFGSTGV